MHRTTHPTPPAATAEAPASLDGFDVLDACHRQTLFTLGKLAALIARLDKRGPDADARALAAEIVSFFATTARQHHADEERHVFPTLLASHDPEIVQDTLRLLQDHFWLEVDWMELEPQLAAVADGTGYDLAQLREGAQIFTTLSHDHIALEESCIYPQARARLHSAERQAMRREMAERRRNEPKAKT